MRYLMVLLLLILMPITMVYGRPITINADFSILPVDGNWSFNILNIWPANDKGAWGEILVTPCGNSFNKGSKISFVCNVKEGIADGTKLKLQMQMTHRGMTVMDQSVDSIHGIPFYLDDSININPKQKPF